MAWPHVNGAAQLEPRGLLIWVGDTLLIERNLRAGRFPAWVPATARLESRYVLETDAADRIYVQNDALRTAVPEVMAKLVKDSDFKHSTSSIGGCPTHVNRARCALCNRPWVLNARLPNHYAGRFSCARIRAGSCRH